MARICEPETESKVRTPLESTIDGNLCRQTLDAMVGGTIQFTSFGGRELVERMLTVPLLSVSSNCCVPT